MIKLSLLEMHWLLTVLQIMFPSI